jgi:RND family efflux transporter MFP subunit
MDKPMNVPGPVRKNRLAKAIPGFFFLLVAGVSLLGTMPSPAVAQQISVSGISMPIQDITLSATVDGTIGKIYFKEGARVRKGQTLLTLDNRLEALEVERRKLLWENKAELESAVARVETLSAQLRSTRELYESTHSVSKDELDQLELQYKLAVAEQKRLEVEEAREKIEYDMARENLAKRSQISPIVGTIIKLFLETGESCEANQPLVHVVNTTRCLFVCNLEEWAGRLLKAGQKVDLRIKTGKETVDKKGTVVFASPIVDPASGLLEVKVEFENADGAVRPGVAGFLLLQVPD